MLLLKLKSGLILNLDHATRISPQTDPATKQSYMDVDIAGRNVSVKDEDDLKALAEVMDKWMARRELPV